jgi:3-deoxy-D-manno-octulosonate 8-phosphate phosphatase (KDO 8-P phosphatase)
VIGMVLASAADLADRCAAIDLLAVDVDGVLTDGVIVLDDQGVESKHFHVRDGLGYSFWHRAGKRSAIMSGRRAEVVARRAAELGISYVAQGLSDKGAALREMLHELSLEPHQVCFVGDDLVDLPVLRAVGLAACPDDAVSEVRDCAHLVTRSPGGRGAVREVIEHILKAQGSWQELCRSYHLPAL